MLPARHAAWWLAALSALLLPLAAAQPAPAAACTLTLSLNASASTVSFNGTNVAVTSPASITGTYKPLNPSALVGLEGSLVLALPGAAPCPTSAADVAARLAGATVQTADGTGLLALYPSNGVALTGDLGNLTLQRVFFRVGSTPFAAASSGTAGSYLTSLTGTVVNGTVLSQSLAKPEAETISLVGSNATNASAVTAAVQGSTLSVTLPVSWWLPSDYKSVVGPVTFAGVNTYALMGQIVAEVTLGCPGNCSTPNGRCAAAADGTVGCTCQCGWTGANCELPSGFCSTFPAELSGQALVCPAVPSSPAPAPPPGGAQPCVPQTCSDRQTYNSATGQCECQPGWGGPGCNACQTSSACDAFFGASGATCSAEPAFQQGMQFKSYTCDLQGTGLEKVIQEGSFYMVCNTSALPPGQSMGSSADQFCQVHFTLSQQKDNPVTCTATECSFRTNSSRVDCATTSCDCQNKDGCSVRGILDDIEGKPCTIDCTSDGLCSFDIQDFIFPLTAPCQTAACVVPDLTFVQGDYKVTTSKSYDPVIAAIPLMVLVALAAFLSTYLLRHYRLFSGGKSSGASKGALSPAAAAAAADGGEMFAAAPSRRRPAHPVQLLTFEGVSCAVPTKPAAFWRRWLPWPRRGGKQTQQQPAAEAAGVTADVTAAAPPRQKLILKSVSGAAACGELVGVLGPSGSGKTTLLAILAGSAEDLDRKASLTGTVLLDGQPLTWSNRRKIAYVAQDDSMLPTLTVEECIRYSAILRLPNARAADVQAAVQSVVSELGLQHVAQTRVGGRSGIRGISGGERRRVTIAMELVTEPSVLVLDEPTSGLDSFTALNLMRSLKQVASGGRIVALSFHQPSPAMFNLLDCAYLMAQGTCIFAGPPSSAEGWFEARGLPCPVGTAVAEHMLDSVSDPGSLRQLLAAHEKEAEAAAAAGTAGANGAALGLPGSRGSATAVQAVADGSSVAPLASSVGPKSTTASFSKLESQQASEAGEEAGAAAGSMAAAEAGTGAGPGALPAAGEGAQGAADAVGARGKAAQWRPGVSRELAVCFWRTLVDIGRNKTLLVLHWILAALMGVFVGAVFFDVTFDVSGAQNRVGAMFFVLCFFAFTSLTTVDLLMLERKMVLREVRGGYYRPGSYLLAKMVLDALLLRVIPVFIFSAAFYPMMGLQGKAATVATFLFVVAAFAGAMGALSLAVTVGCSTAGTANLIMNILLLVAVVISGMLVNPESMPAWIRWTHWLSPFYYAYGALMINEMSGIKIDFELKGYAAASNVRGTVFLETIGINPADLSRDIIVTNCFYLGLALLAFVLLYLVMPRPCARKHGMAFWLRLLRCAGP